MKSDIPGQIYLFADIMKKSRKRKDKAARKKDRPAKGALTSLQKAKYCQEDLAVLWADVMTEYGEKLSEEYTTLHSLIAKIGVVMAAELRKQKPKGKGKADGNHAAG